MPENSTQIAADAATPATGGPPAARAVAAPGRARAGWVRSIPLWVWLVGALAGVVHMAPYWRAAAQTPDGWSFTANLSVSPDYMQYRVWMRQTQVEGPLVSNVFTTEPNGRHLPVLLYWGIGTTARLTGLAPEWVYAWLGALLAIPFAAVLYAVVRAFAPGAAATRWIFGALLVAGGLGGYIKLLEEWDWARGFAIVNRIVFAPLTGSERTALFEDFRGNYIVQALFDTHFLVFWLISTVAVFSLYRTVRRCAVTQLAATAALFAFGTILHVYEGLTLLCIAGGVLLMCWRRGLRGRTALIIGAALGAAVAVPLVAIAAVLMMSGAPTPTWRGLDVLPSILLLAYPLAWLLIAYGGVRYWTEAGLDEAFLVGWALGCLALVASGPFFPYPDRGTMTLQIPLFIIAGSIFFRSRVRIGAPAIVVLVLLLGSTPVWLTKNWIQRTTFKPHETHKWMTPGHVQMAALLAARSARDDVLLADPVPLRWLAPDYPGRHYAGHFFLTARFEQKRRQAAAFYSSMTAEERVAFLRREGIDWVFADSSYDAATFSAVPGLSVTDARGFGTLFNYAPAGSVTGAADGIR